ncbi:Mini-ribonuclease 3 [Gottschalkia acidurici]|nr:Mini-ribonuclease 3 [Gottschalkia acidurici]
MSDEYTKGIEMLVEQLNIKDVRQLSPLQLAYIGDAVYELLVRTYILSKKNISVHHLHKEAIKYVKAKAQRDILFSIEENLTEEEWNVVKRGRNAKSGTVPKNADLQDYKYSTGFEALIGFLYLLKRYDRLDEIFNMIIKQH